MFVRLFNAWLDYLKHPSPDIDMREAVRDAVIANDIPKVIELAQAGASLNGYFYSNEPTNPIVYAAHNRMFPMVRTLVELGADVNGEGEFGETALITASYNGDFDVVQYLLEHGADATATDRGGATAIEAGMHCDAVVALIQAHIKAKKQNNDQP